MTLQQLHYIVALANHGQFVKAAKSCFVSQPTLTMQVKKLEEEMGILLFDRDQHPIKPTEAGEKVIAYARRILQDVDQLKAVVSDEKETLKGEFKIGIIPTLAPYLLPLFLPAFLKEHPQSRLIIREMQTEQIITDLNQGLLDIGLLATPLEEKRIREIPLFNEPFLLYLPLTHPLQNETNITVDQLQPRELLVLEQGHCFRDQALAICGQGKKKRQNGFDFTSGSIESIKGLVKNGLGYTLIPELSVKSQTDNNFIKHFSNPQPVREISLAVHNSFTKEALIEALHAVIIKSIPPHFQQMTQFTRVKWR